MLLVFASVLAASTAAALYTTYKAVSTAPTAVSPQEVAKFFTFGSIRDRRLRVLAAVFHTAIVTSLLGHLFIFIKEVPPYLPKVGTALGFLCTVALLTGLLSRLQRGSFATILTLATAVTGTLMGLTAPRDYLISAAVVFPNSLDLPTALLVFHVVCATALAASLAWTSASHITAPVAYLYIKARGRKLRKLLEMRRRQVLD